MENKKLTINTFVALAVSACSSNSKKPDSVHAIASTTEYSITTRQLKSNTIPDSVFQMTHLKHLSVRGMDCDTDNNTSCWAVTIIPSQVQHLRNLESISLAVNAISTISVELAELKNLRSINLSDNPGLSTIDNLAKIQRLELLYLYGCNLTKLPDNIGDLKNLKELGLIGNNLDSIERTRLKRVLPTCKIFF